MDKLKVHIINPNHSKIRGYMDRSRPYMYGAIIGMISEYLFRVGYNFWPVLVLVLIVTISILDIFFNVFKK